MVSEVVQNVSERPSGECSQGSRIMKNECPLERGSER